MAVTRRRLALAIGLAVVIAVGVGAVVNARGGRSVARPPSRHLTPAKVPVRPPPARRSVQLGHSVSHRPIGGVILGDASAPAPVLVIGCVHGNEPAGIAIADRLAHGPLPRRGAMWIVRDLNPDGVAAGTRQNADGVDLNRNFPYRWLALGVRGDQQYSGPRPLSEPESVLAHALILRLRPRITIWFHQPLGVTDSSGGQVRVERRFSQLSGLPLRRLVRYPGSAAGWQNQAIAGTTAFVAELPPGPASPREVTRIAAAVRRLVDGPGPT